MENQITVDSIKKVIKELNRKKKLKKYYLEEMRNGKTYIAMIFDGILFKSILLLLSYGFFYRQTGSLIFSSIISVQFLILYILISHKIKKIRLRKAKKKINYQVVKKKIYKDLINQSPYEFIEEVKSNLEKCDFADIQLSNDRDIDLVGVFKDKKIGIKCFQYKNDYKVGINIVRELFGALRRNEFEKGMIVTTSSFSGDANELLTKLKEYLEIYPIDIDNFIDIKRKAETYPTEKEVESIILKRIADRKRKLREYRDTVLSKGKSTKYFLLSFIIFSLREITPYPIYYKLVAIIPLALGIVSGVKWIVEKFVKIENEEKESII